MEGYCNDAALPGPYVTHHWMGQFHLNLGTVPDVCFSNIRSTQPHKLSWHSIEETNNIETNPVKNTHPHGHVPEHPKMSQPESDSTYSLLDGEVPLDSSQDGRAWLRWPLFTHSMLGESCQDQKGLFAQSVDPASSGGMRARWGSRVNPTPASPDSSKVLSATVRGGHI